MQKNKVIADIKKAAKDQQMAVVKVDFIVSPRRRLCMPPPQAYCLSAAAAAIC